MRFRLAFASISTLVLCSQICAAPRRHAPQASQSAAVPRTDFPALPQLRFSTNLGGASLDEAKAIATAPDGSLFAAGVTRSTDFPGTAMAPRLAGHNRAFLAKFSSDGKKLVWSLYFGGSGDDDAHALAVDATGNVYVAGRTTSTDFPVVNAFQSSCRLDSTNVCHGNAFLAKFSPAGELLFATYFGGSGDDAANAIAVDPTGNIFVAGETTSSDFPVLRAFQGTSAGGREGFLAKFARDGHSLTFSSYLGGAGDDSVRGVALDSTGNVFLTGQSRSLDFPVRGAAMQSSCRSVQTSQCTGSAFVIKVAADGQSLAYSTYLGGSREDAANSIAVDAQGNAYVTGSAQSSDFPLAHPLFSSLTGASHAFVSKLDPQGAALLYSTFLGGNVEDAGQAIAVDASGRAHITGWTRSLDFPSAHAPQSTCKLNAQGECKGAAFASVLSVDGQTLLFSTYLGGSGGDRANAVSIDPQGALRLAGSVSSSDFPLTNAVQSAAPVSGDAFVAKLDTGLVANAVSNCATAKQWNNAAGGDFNTATNWTPSGVPGASDDACIPNTFAGVTVTFSSGTVTVNSLTAFSTFTFSSGSLTLTTGGQLAVTNLSGGSLTTNGALLLSGATALTAGTLTGSGDITSSALFTWTGGQLAGTATPNATFAVSAAGIDFKGAFANGVGHQLNQRTLNLFTGTTTVSGQTASLSLSSGAILHVPSGGTLLFDQDGGFSNNQGIFNGGGSFSTLANDGIIRKAAGNTGNTFFGVVINNTGTVESLSGAISLNGNLLQTAGITRANGGVINGGSTLTIQGGTLLGVDVGVTPGYTANLSNTGGIVHPGLSPGILSLVGTLNQTAAGNFNVDINGTTPGTGFSQLNITGSATLGGTLNVTLGGGFTPSAGNTFTVMTFTSHTGDFTIFNAPALPGGLVWTKTVTATAVILTTNPPSVPDLTITKTHNGNFTQGQTGATYTITVANAGTGPSSGTVSISDTLPAGLTATAISGTGWTCTLGNPTSTCNRSDALANGSSYPAITLTVNVSNTAPASVTNTATVSGGGETNTGNDSASDLTTISSLPDLVLAIADAPDPVIAGNNLAYTITVTNNGGSAASAATVSDTLPAGVSLVSVASSQGACAALPCNLGTINPAANATVTITVKAAPATRGSLSNTASVTETQTDANNANNSSTATTTVNASADLSLTNVGAPSPVTAGTNITYTIVATNAGPSTATSVSVADTLPAGTSFVATGSTAGCSAAGQTVTCPAGTLAPAANTTITILAAVAPATRGALANTATVTATEPDPNAANNSATANTNVNTSADLAITKTASPSPVTVGNNLTYTITLTNNGPSTATGVTATDTLPANISFVSATLSQGTCTLPPTTTLACNIGTMNPAASVTATVVVTPTATGSLTNTIVAAAAETDPNPANNTATSTVTVNSGAGADFTLTAVPVTSTVVAGGSASYTLTLAPLGGFNKAIAITCTVDTMPASCNALPASVTLDGTHSGTSAITVLTTRNSFAPPAPQAPPSQLDPRNLLRLVLLGMTALALALASRATRKTQRIWSRGLGFAAAVLLISSLAAGCANGGKKGNGTPTGTHQVTITGTSGTTTHNVSVALTVQ